MLKANTKSETDMHQAQHNSSHNVHLMVEGCLGFIQKDMEKIFKKCLLHDGEGLGYIPE